MSSSIYFRFDEGSEVEAKDWAFFCANHGIVFEPHVPGANTFYAGAVEIDFGDPDWTPLPKLADGSLDFGAAIPPERASRVSFGTYHFGSAMPDVARLAREFWLIHDGSVSTDPELKRLFLGAPSMTNVVRWLMRLAERVEGRSWDLMVRPLRPKRIKTPAPGRGVTGPNAFEVMTIIKKAEENNDN